MTPEVKERIEQIRHGNVPEGYEKLSVGIFPRQWNSYRLDQLLEFKNGINTDKEKFGHGTKLISVRDILSERPITYESILGAVDIDEQQRAEFAVEYGDVLFQRSSENYEDAGTSNVYLDQDNTAVFSGFVIRGKKKADYNPVYFNELLKCFYARKQIMRQAAGAQHINIGQESLAKVCIALASSAEQNRMAEIITEQDRFIELKEKLLAEKQRQKKYLMQQLLTGKKRLPGFDGEWRNVKLNEVLLERKEKNANQDHRICSVAVQKGVVDQIEHLGRSYAAADTSNYGVAHFGDIIYTKSPTGEFPYGIIKQSHMDEAVAVSPLYGIYEPSCYELGYLLHTYFSYAVNCLNYLTPIVQKGAKNTINITNDVFVSKELYLPMNQAAQKALASIFMAADKEIELLTQSVAREKQKKKALMQLLLTGIVRVTE